MASTTKKDNALTMDSKLYQLLVTGDATATDVLSNTQVDVVELGCERDDNSVLHVAASLGHVELVQAILSRWAGLMVKGNSKGDLPIHAALKCGKLRCVKALTTWLQGKEEVADQVFGAKNNGEGSTPLHIALEYDHQETAKELVELYPRASYAMNHEGTCPLYLALQKQLPDLVRHMLNRLRPFKRDTLASLSQGKSVLHAAVYQQTPETLSMKQKEILEELLSYDDEELLKLRDTKGWTALSFAACSRSVEIVRVFQEKVPNSAFISNEDKDASFPIHVAVHGGKIEIIDSLTSTWSQVDAKYRNILHVASFTGSSRIVRHLLTKLPGNKEESLVNHKDEDGNTPLHLAVRAKCAEAVAVLIQDPRVDIKLSNKKGLTAHDVATSLVTEENVEDKGVQRLKLMLDRATKGLKNYQIGGDLYSYLVHGSIDEINTILGNISVRFQDLISLEDGNNVLHFIACMDNPSPFVHLLSDQDCTALMEQANLNGDLPIHSAAKADNLLRLETLFQLQYNSIPVFGRQNMDGNTALHEALLNNHYKIAKVLYEKHKNAAYCLNKDLICPLFLFIKNWSDIDLVSDMIIQMKGNEDVQNQLKDAKSVVHMAIFAKRIDILKLIIDEAPRLVNSFDSRGRSPLSYAAYLGYVNGVLLLLKHDPNLEFKRDNVVDGSFPIHYAAEGGQPNVMKLLTLSEILVNNNKQNALHVAAGVGSVTVVSYLLEQPKFKGLLNTGDGNGNTPLHLAVESFHPGVVDRLVSEEHIDGNSTNKELLTARDLLQRHPIMHSNNEDHWSNALYQKRKSIKKMLRRVKGENSILREKGEDQEGDQVEKKTTRSNSILSTAPNWQKANILLVVATLLITLSYTAIVNPPGGYNKDGIPVLLSSDNYHYKTFYYTTCGAFALAVVAALVLLAAAVTEIKSPILLQCGASALFMGLILISVSSSAGLRAIDQYIHPQVKYNNLTVVLTYAFLPVIVALFIPWLQFLYELLISTFDTYPGILKLMGRTRNPTTLSNISSCSI